MPSVPFLAGCATLLLALPGASDREELHARGERLLAELPTLCELAKLPGISVAMADARGLAWSGAWGVRSTSGGEPVDGDTVFEAASLSKPVFAYVVLQLVDQGVMELDAPLARHGELTDLAHDVRAGLLTVRMVLSHQTGLPNWRPEGGRLELETDPGTRWRYSGEGFVLLQRAAERATGETLEELARRLVFEPLGMSRSSYVWRPAFEANEAHPHGEDQRTGKKRRMREPNAAFSLLTTAPDYARFLAALLRGEGLSEESHAALLAPQVPVSPGVTWGLGVGLEENPDGHAFWHWGHNDGYRAYFVAYPARGEAVVYFANGDNGMRLLRDVAGLGSEDDEHPAVDHLGYPEYED